MKNQKVKSNLLLLITAAIWGFAFVAQRVGGEYVGSYTFNGVRFALGSLSLLPLILYNNFKSKNTVQEAPPKSNLLAAGIAAGLILFIGASLQQIGLEETTAGKAAFITGLYIVLVPILGIFLKHRMQLNSWLGALVALVGLYFLCITEQFTITRGDMFELIGSFFWAVHILLIDHFSRKVDALQLSSVQFAVCSVLSLIIAVFTESIQLSGLLQAAVPILYGGLCSVGIAYTLQVVGQKHAHPSHAAIILSMETVFATIGGFLLLNEVLSLRGVVGSLLMLTGMLLAQLPVFQKKTASAVAEL